MAENGANEYDIQVHLRHKSVRSTEIYIHISSGFSIRTKLEKLIIFGSIFC